MPKLDILILGIDGYIGWPLACELMERGHTVMGIDGGYKRSHYAELREPEAQHSDKSLFELSSIPDRGELLSSYHGVWKDNIVGTDALVSAIGLFSPDMIIDLAEIGSRAFAMSDNESANLTAMNNMGIINAVIAAVREHKYATHIMKVSTIEATRPIMDVCTASLAMSTMLLEIACDVRGLRATEIRTGLVYGTRTKSMLKLAEMTRFDYDFEFGNVVHRFIVQAMAGSPITVYGTGRQKIGIIHLEDTVRFIADVAERTPITAGTFNEHYICTQAITVGGIADTVAKTIGERTGIKIGITHVDNPRGEEDRETMALPSEWKPARPIRFGKAEVNRIADDIEPFSQRISRTLVKTRDPVWGRK